MKRHIALCSALASAVLLVGCGTAAADGLLGYLEDSGLHRLYVEELRSLCLEASDLGACRAYVDLLAAEGQYEAAIEFADSVGTGETEANHLLAVMKAEVLVAAARYDEALALVDTLIASLPPRPILIRAAFLRSACLYHLGSYDEALMDLRAIGAFLDLPRPVEFVLLQGGCEEGLGNILEAQARYQEALNRGSAGGALGLIRIMLKAGGTDAVRDLLEEAAESGLTLPAGDLCELVATIGTLIPDVWQSLLYAALADTDFTARSCPQIVDLTIRLAEAGSNVATLADSLLRRGGDPETMAWLRYGRTLAAGDPLGPCDTLVAVYRSTTDPDLKLRCAAACLSALPPEEASIYVRDLAPFLLDRLDRFNPDERLEAAAALLNAGLRDEVIDRMQHDLDGDNYDVGHDDAALVAIGSVWEELGRPDIAFDVYARVMESPIPSAAVLEAEKRSFVLEHRVAADLDISAELERIATEGASDAELGDFFMFTMGDFAKAATRYRRALAAMPEGADATDVKLRLIRSLVLEWLDSGEDARRRDALDLVGETIEADDITAGEAIEAVKMATDWLGSDQRTAFELIRRIAARNDMGSGDLYAISRSLYHLFSGHDGNIFAECVIALRRLLEDYPDAPEAPLAALLLAEARFAAGDYVTALKGYESCLEAWPDSEVSLHCYRGIGECYLYSGGVRRAIRYLVRAGESPEVAYKLGRCYEEIARPDSARLHYGRSLERLSTPAIADAARFRLAYLELTDGEVNAELAILDSPFPAVRERRRVAGQILKAFALGKTGYDGLALRFLREFGAADTRLSCDALLLASELIGPEDADTARGVLRPGEDVCDDIFGVLGLLRERALRGCATPALDICRSTADRYTERFPLDRPGHIALELTSLLQQFREGDADRAVSELDSLIASGIDHPLIADCLYKKGTHLLVNRAYSAAIEAFRRIEREYPRSDLYHDACFKLGTAYYMGERYDSSAFYFDIAARSERASLVENALFNGGLALDKYGDLDGAAATLRRLAFRFPLSQRFERAWMRVAYADERGGRFEKAIAVYESLIQYTVTAETAAEARYWIGEAYAGLGDHIRAALEFLRCAHLNPEEAAWAGTAAFQAGVECERAGLTDHAIIVYRENVRRFGTGTDWGSASAERLATLEAVEAESEQVGSEAEPDAESPPAVPDRED